MKPKNKGVRVTIQFRSKRAARLIDLIEEQLEGNLSRRAIKRLLEAGRCRVSGQVERFASQLVSAGVSIEFRLEKEVDRVWRFERERILYEDEDLLAYDKPPGIPTDGDGLILLAQKYDPSLLVVHRLDKDTSGVLLFAKGDPEHFFNQFRERSIQKIYWAISDGRPRNEEGEIRNYLALRSTFQGQKNFASVAKAQGRLAVTRWRVEASGHGASWIILQPKTGRTHQLRVHLSEMGHPILGDGQYGRRTRCSFRAARCLLHARSLRFSHPKTGQCMTIEAEAPDDFKAALDYIRGV